MPARRKASAMCRKARSGVQQVRSMPYRRHNGSSRQEHSSRQCKGLRCRNAAQQGLRPRPHSAPQHRKLLPRQMRRGVHLHAPRQGALQTKARQALRPLLLQHLQQLTEGGKRKSLLPFPAAKSLWKSPNRLRRRPISCAAENSAPAALADSCTSSLSCASRWGWHFLPGWLQVMLLR